MQPREPFHSRIDELIREYDVLALKEELDADIRREAQFRRLGWLCRQPKLTAKELEEMRATRRELVVKGGRK